jgi:hypothetical protein
MKRTQILPVIVVWVYASAVAVAIAYMLRMAQHDAFCGLPAVVLTMPWSMLLTFAVALVAPGIFDSIIPETLIMLISATANGWILFKIALRWNTNGKKGD